MNFLIAFLVFVLSSWAAPLEFHVGEKGKLLLKEAPDHHERFELDLPGGRFHVLYGKKAYFHTVAPKAENLLTSQLQTFTNLSRNLDPARLENPALPTQGLRQQDFSSGGLQWKYALVPLTKGRNLLSACALLDAHPIYLSGVLKSGEATDILKAVIISSSKE